MISIHPVRDIKTASYAELTRAWNLCLWIHRRFPMTGEQTAYWDAVENELDLREEKEQQKKELLHAIHNRTCQMAPR
jgi:hypothetical protein